MKNYYNIEKIKNSSSQYTGYANGSWKIYGKHGNWNARKISGEIVGKMKLLVGFDTLAEISAELENISRNKK